MNEIWNRRRYGRELFICSEFSVDQPWNIAEKIIKSERLIVVKWINIVSVLFGKYLLFVFVFFFVVNLLLYNC